MTVKMTTRWRASLWWSLLLAIALSPCCKSDSNMEVKVEDGKNTEVPDVMLQETIDLGVEQNIYSLRADEVIKCIEDAKDYVRDVVSKDPSLAATCKLFQEHCANWAVLGECDKSVDYMNTQCGPVCHTCVTPEASTAETLDPEQERCKLDVEKTVNTWEPGDLGMYFTNIMTSEKYKQYDPQLLSAPSYLPGDSEETVVYKVKGPWLVVLENVLSAEEAFRLIELGAVEGFDDSYDVGEGIYDGDYEKELNTGRTSTTAWCVNDCYADEIAQGVIQRITELTEIPEENSEHLHLLKYQMGELYSEHHDYIKHQTNRQSGVRIMTVLLYLNDVESGGGTHFPQLNITVLPKQGRALMWPDVRDGAPNKRDDRTVHQALPVIKGVKYAAKAWIHQRDYKTPKKNGCDTVEIIPP